MNKRAILDAYMETVTERITEAKNLKVGANVQTRDGVKCKVIAFSENFDDVRKYDSSKLATTIFENHGTKGIWVAVKNSAGQSAVFTYGDEGVIMIKESTKRSEHNLVDDSIIGAYFDVLNEFIEPTEDDKEESEEEEVEESEDEFGADDVDSINDDEESDEDSEEEPAAVRAQALAEEVQTIATELGVDETLLTKISELVSVIAELTEDDEDGEDLEGPESSDGFGFGEE